MRILHVIPSYYPAVRYGGPVRSVHGLCKSLVKKGIEVDVFTTNIDGNTFSDVPLDEWVNLDGVNIKYFQGLTPRRMFYAPSLARELDRSSGSYDLLHLHSVFLWPTYVAARIASRVNKPYLLSPRGMLVKSLFKRRNYLLKSIWLKLIESKTIKLSAGLHVTSEIEAAELKAFGLVTPHIFTVPNGIEVPELGNKSETHINYNAFKPYILFLGRLNWKKGIDQLIRAMNNIDQVNLLVAGNDEDNYQESLANIIVKSGLEERVHFTGEVNEANKWNLYADAELFILPSYSENFGNVVLEAMSMGCPVVVTPDVGLAPVVTRSGAGVVVENSPELLANTINNLIRDTVLRKQMGEKGRNEIQRHYSWNNVSKQMLDVYQLIINT